MFETLAHSERTNAVVGWLAVGILAAAVPTSFLTDALLWVVFSLVTLGVALVPPAVTRDPVCMLPWPVLALAAVATVGRLLEVYPEVAGYLAIAAVAMMVVVELDAYAPVEFSRRFAIVFAMLTTMAIAAVWIVAQFYSDVWLGTSFLGSQTELQQSIVAVTVVGLVVGAVFEWFFATFEPVGTIRSEGEGVGTE